VTGVTGQTLFDMLLVVKVDRLSGFQSRGEANEEEEKKETDCQSKEKELHSLGLLVLTAKSVYRERYLILT
jgi:hypothetical protein